MLIHTDDLLNYKQMKLYSTYQWSDISHELGMGPVTGIQSVTEP